VLSPQPVVKKKRVVFVERAVQFGSTAAGVNAATGAATFELILTARGKTKPREKVLGKAPVINGRASLSFKMQTVLNQKIDVVYAGDADYQPATVMLPVVTRVQN
jgi:hypothetical protein